MAPLRVIFLMVIIVTVVSVVSGRDIHTRGSSRFDALKHQVKEKSSKFGDKLKAITGSEKAQKYKGWGKKYSDKHPGIKEKGEKLWAKMSGFTNSAKHSKKGTKARGLANNLNTKAKDTVRTVKRELKNLRTFLRGAKSASAMQSKLSGLTKSFTSKRSVGGSTTALKSVLQSGSNKFSSMKEKAASKLAQVKQSQALQKIQNKLPKNSLDSLKKLPGADKLQGLASGSAGTKVKDSFASLKSVAAGLTNKS